MKRIVFAYLCLLGGFASQARAVETVYYIHTDALGSPVAMTDANRNVVERTQYGPYGEVLNRPEHDGPGYTGHEEDAATGLTNMQQRYDDKVIGRMLSVDPMDVETTAGSNFNRYAYANDNPYRYTDPDGRCTGSLISNSDGTCTSTGGNTTGTNGAAQGLEKALSAAGQFAIGVAKAVTNKLDKVLSMLPHGESDGFGDSSEDGPPLAASNGTQASGVVVGGIVASAAIAAATDDPAVGEAGGARALDATAPVGRLGSPLDVPRGTNQPGSVEGIEYSGHAFDQMQGRGLTPSVVRNTIETGMPTPGRNGATVYYDRINNTTVITNPSGRVITVYPGGG